MAKKWTKTDLEAAVKEFNKFIDPEHPILTGDDTTIKQLEADIKDITENFLTPDDELSEETTKLLELMGLVAPMSENPKKEPIEPKGEAADKKKTKKEEEEKEKTKKAKYTRAQAFCDALKGEAKTITEIAEKAKDLHGNANPDKKQPQLMSIEWAVRDYIQPLVILGFVKEENKKYSLK